MNNTPPTTKGLYEALFGTNRDVVVRTAVACSRCGKLSPSRLWKRQRCSKCKARVDHEAVVLKVLIYEVTGSHRKRLSEEEMGEAMHTWALHSGSHGPDPCPDCKEFERKRGLAAH